MDNEGFTARLKLLREIKGWSQRETSLALGWTASSYRDIELRIKKCHVKDLVDIAALYGVGEEWLLHGYTDTLSEEWQKEIKLYREEMTSHMFRDRA